MRAAVFQGVGNGLEVRDVPDPVPADRHVIIRVGRCGICGTDLDFTTGVGFMQAAPGRILGHEYAGEIVEVGSGVERLRLGDHITALAIPCCGRCPACRKGEPQFCTGEPKIYGGGAYAEFAPVAEPQAVKLPTSLPWPDAALVEPLAVGLHACHLAELSAGSDLLVIGAGPIALSAVYWARRMGAGRIVVQASSRRRQHYAEAVGASHFIVSGDDPVASAIEALGGSPPYVFEAAGVPGTIELAMQIVQPGGTVVVMGWCSVPDSFVPAKYLQKQVRLQFSMTYTVAEFHQTITALDADAVDARSMISQTVGLDELPEVFESLRRGADQCKVMIDPWATAANSPRG